ncbi:hypothetical protein SCA6_000538 [Theobroma cacao]
MYGSAFVLLFSNELFKELELGCNNLASTPAIFNSTLTEDEAFLCPVDGVIMIRGSLRLYSSEDGIFEYLVIFLITGMGSVQKVDYMAVYTSDLVKAVRKAAGNVEKPLEGFHIIVDAGNGAGEFFAAKVLEPLGAITSGCQFLEPVLDNKADLGIIFDTEVDRGKAPYRFTRGYKNVIDEAIRMNSVGEESHLAVESSGQGALKEDHWLDDGSYLMVKLLNKLASARASVLKHLENSIASDPKLQKAPVNYEEQVSLTSFWTQIRVSGFGGWVLLRLPLHDHVLPLNIEAPSREDAVKFGLEVAAAVKEFPALDTSALDKFVQPQYAERRSLSAFGLCSSGCRLFRDELTCLT